MRLLRCHIENFGTLQNWDFDFSEGLNQFYQENGYGKTTLAAFLKAMFYGLPSYKTTTTKFNDRMHYYPFNAGKFGGSLTFEMQGKEYRIERYFDKKSETEDSLTVYRNGKPFDGFHAEIGREVFGLDKESFERTAFFIETDAELCATSAIGEKLNKFVANTPDSVGFDAAAAALEKVKKSLKKKGSGGRIDEVRTRIASLSREVDSLETISATLPARYAAQHKLQEEIAAAQDTIKAAEKKNLVLEKWKHLESLSQREQKLKKEAELILEQYRGGVPQEEELIRAKREMERVHTLRELKASYIFPDEKVDRLERYDRIFQRGVPSEQVLQEMGARADEVKRLQAVLAAGDTDKDERLRRLEQRFAIGLASEKKEREIKGAVEEYRKLQQATPAASPVLPKKKRPLYLVLALAAILVALAGVGLLFVNAIIGGALLGVGVVGLGAVAFLYLKGQSAPVQSAENAAWLRKLQSLESTIREFLVPYGYYSQNGVLFDFSTYEKDKQEFLEKRATRCETLTKTERVQAKCEDLQKELSAFFEGYRIHEEDFQLALVTLRQEIRTYAALQAEEKEFDEKQYASQKEVEKSLNAAKKVYEKYALSAQPSLEHVDKMLVDCRELARLEAEISLVKSDAEKYKRENGLTQMPQGMDADVAPMHAIVDEKQRELASLQRQITDAEADAERLDDVRARKEAAEEELIRLQERHAVVSAALTLLTEADRSLKDKYVEPVKSTFLRYADAIESALGERMSMDADFSISFERGGEKRSDKYLSAGQRSVLSLVFRLALIKNMYEDEQPFLILDDPFTTLDEEHFARTATLVKSLAKDMQIIYFCCHKSRKI